MHLKENTTLQGGRYRIIRTLGQGGFGITYLAEDTMLGVNVALKEFFIGQYCNRDANTGLVTVGVESMRNRINGYYEKFLKEAGKIRMLNHSNIVRVYEVFRENGTAYYAMDYHSNGSLSGLVKKQGALSESDALRYIRQVASALKYIHSRNMVHLDIKPDNILLDNAGNAILIDFGISKHYDSNGKATTITPGAYTPGYAANSQMSGSKINTFSPTLDIYSLGATLYNLITGEEPPLITEILDYGFSSMPAAISSSTRNAIEKSMAPKSAERPKSVDEFLSVLDSRNTTLPGRLFVTTSPAGATVTVDGKHIGNTPIERYELKKGVYTLKITKEGYNTISKNITISNDPAIINVTLTTIDKQQVKNSKEKDNQNNKPTKQEIEKYYYDGLKAYYVGNYSEAVRLYRKAAEQGYANAQYNLGYCYEYGTGVTKDLNEAVKWYRKAAEQGDAHAQYNLGECYHYGRGVTEDETEAVKWYRKAAERGYAHAQYSLGYCYEKGQGVPQNYTEAVKWYRKAAEQGYAHAQYRLALCYDNGRGVAKDYTEAVKWYRKAAEQGNARAQCNLGLCYKYGTGVTEDETEAVKWYRKAAEQGNVYAQYSLGVSYEYSTGVAKDLNEAVKWYRKAAEQGYVYAQYSLGCCYYNGEGVTKDYTEAVKWYHKAAEQGYAHAKYKLALCYDNGRGVTKDLNEAVKWYRKAAEQGYAHAKYNLGLCYEYGTGVTKDLNEAVRWYREAAEQGNAAAQCNLGYCYEYSKGVIKNLNEAAEWYRKAAEQGDATAKAALLRLFPPLPAEKTSSDSNETNRATEQKSAKAANVSRATQQMNKNGASRSTQQMNNPTVKNKQDRTANGSRGNEKARKSFNWKLLVGIIAAILCIIFAGVGINECNDYRDEQQRLAAIRDSIAADKKRNAFETKIFNVNGIEFTMVPVDGGTFNMFNRGSIYSDTLSDYYIGETEVTQELWKAVMGSNPSYSKGDKYPVERVSYNDCIDFINKLNTLLAGQLPDSSKFRLPTEAQWEFAARGGNKGKNNNNKYSGSNSIDDVAWYRDNSGNRTHPVKQKQANELGLYDTSGNVLEWCSDWYADYSSSPQTNPERPFKGEGYRVLRGGCYHDDARGCRVAYRRHNTPDSRYINFGLRLAID